MASYSPSSRPANICLHSGLVGITHSFTTVKDHALQQGEENTDGATLHQQAHTHRGGLPTVSHWERRGALTRTLEWANTALTHLLMAPTGTWTHRLEADSKP